MPKKYLSQEEAAAELGVSVEELKAMREDGNIRGFADRGTWKFRLEDVQELARSRQATSDPEIPLLSDSAIDEVEDEVGAQATTISGGGSALDDDEPLTPGPSDSDVRLILDDSLEAESGSGPLKGSDPGLTSPDSDIDVDGELAKFDDGDSDLKRASSPDAPPKGEASDSDVRVLGSDSDSDVRLAPTRDPFEDSDSDVRLAPSGSAAFEDSDSDVRLVLPSDSSNVLDDGPDGDVKLIGSGVLDASDSDVKLVPGPAESSNVLGGSDSDVKLIGDSGLAGSDSDVKLISSDSGTDEGSDSDVALVGEGSGLLIGDDDEDVFGDEGGGGATLIRSEGSGILAPDDSGINLEVGGGSGVLLEDDSDLQTGAADATEMFEDGDDLFLGDDASEITLDNEPSSISLDGDDLALDAGASGNLDATMSEIDEFDLDEDEDDKTAHDMPVLDDDGGDTFELEIGADDDSNVLAFEDEEADEHAATAVRKEIDDDEETFNLAADDFGDDDELEDEFDEFEDDFQDDELEVAADIEGEDDELDDLDVFDEADDFDEDFEVGGTAAPAGGVAAGPAEPEWGALPFSILLLSFFSLTVGGMMMYDLVRNMWAAGGPTSTGTDLLDWFANTLFS